MQVLLALLTAIIAATRIFDSLYTDNDSHNVGVQQ
jgi:hypothetical protein